MAKDFPIPPAIIGDQRWDQFTKRELIAARIMEHLVAQNTKLERPINGLGAKFLAELAVDLTDNLLRELSRSDDEK